MSHAEVLKEVRREVLMHIANILAVVSWHKSIVANITVVKRNNLAVLLPDWHELHSVSVTLSNLWNKKNSVFNVIILNKPVQKSLHNWTFFHDSALYLLANWPPCTIVNFAVDKDACCLLSGSLLLQGTDLLFLASVKGWGSTQTSSCCAAGISITGFTD